ncbi:sulfatase-like hydrolase/transferase [Natrinema salsiterrestre]|uniref:Sulfatase-like hydrolase/transferase n=1 Tax=Natrinema salsiterrestre TaxID=2950540 RepID=A0A9Q4L4M8_9EURY|nr:sulfatase-like hydrolase/transferase [Natrinema salsiterrestre]MDF9745865.1 sulfatase-like hydrolase/transferase [Natrinema salsiterrestre]
MEKGATLSSLTELSAVDNVVIYISDSLRFDAVPQRVSDTGIFAKAVAPSTYTGSSVPSLMTGVYPAQHRIWGFDNQLSSTPGLLDRKNSAYDVNDIWDWPLEMLGIDDRPTFEELKKERRLADLNEPFVYVLHDKGGHLPYGYHPTEFESIKEYLREFNDPDELRNLYHSSVEKSVDMFNEIVETLKDRNIYQNTLVIFTSDHGELLGEYGGRWGHGSPMVPELVEVPILFCGAGLPTDESVDTLISGTDIVPTSLSALGENKPVATDGCDLWSSWPEERAIRSDVWLGSSSGRLGAQYVATSAWDRGGGYVFHRKPLRSFLKTVGSQYLGATAPVSRTYSLGGLLSTMRPLIQSPFKYKQPNMSVSDVEEIIPNMFETGQYDPEQRAEPDKEQLRKLGYLS